MAWKAIENIGDYKIGDTVPTEIAVVWNSMYKKSPVEEVKKEKVEKVVEPVIETKEPESVEESGMFGRKKKSKK